MGNKYFTDFEVVDTFLYNPGDKNLVVNLKTKKVIIDIFKIVSFSPKEERDNWVEVILENGISYVIVGYKLEELVENVCEDMKRWDRISKGLPGEPRY